MKASLITLHLLLLFVAGISQNLNYEIRGTFARPITVEKISEASSLSDIVYGFPSSWIGSYVSVEITASNNGRSIKAVSTNETLTAEQKNILQTAGIGTGIDINVQYKMKNASANSEARNMHVAMTVVPETEAAFVGGREQMMTYLKKTCINKLPEAVFKGLKMATVKFVVNEAGEVTNAVVSKTSADAVTDKLLLEAINKMPKWKPAQNSKGVKVKQAFEFRVAEVGC